ncbi:MAG: PEP-CTERM sorting domain-containing protein [Candidatus Korobacteraceae bacterium]
MTTRIAVFALLCLGLAVPAWAQNWSYDNGPINGNVDAWYINFGNIVSDTFVAGGPLVNGFSLGVETIFSNDIVTSLDWSITSGENGGTTFGAGTASGANLTDKYISSNQFGFVISEVTVSGLNVPTTSGTTYWLNLQSAQTATGDPVAWDENSGVGCMSDGCPSKASQNLVGTIPSESFTISGSGSGTTPEPSSILLLSSGILGLAGLMRRKLF